MLKRMWNLVWIVSGNSIKNGVKRSLEESRGGGGGGLGAVRNNLGKNSGMRRKFSTTFGNFEFIGRSI